MSRYVKGVRVIEEEDKPDKKKPDKKKKDKKK